VPSLRFTSDLFIRAQLTDGEGVLAKCEEDPRFGYELLKRFSALMSERLRHARLKMMEEWQPPGMA
jgi:CRP/FNR family transcriptional regulator, cyclic AMP receptor protein